MTYIPGSGGGSGNIATSGDVALSNATNGDVLAYDSGVAKWKNSNAVTSIASSKADLSSVVTGGPVRVSGGAFHFFNDPAVDPGTDAQPGDIWVGNIV